MKILCAFLIAVVSLAAAHGQCPASPPFHVTIAAGPQADLAQPLLLMDYTRGNGSALTQPSFLQATDMTGAVQWSYCPGSDVWLYRPLGNYLYLLATDAASSWQLEIFNAQNSTVTSSVDLTAVNAQLTARGLQTVLDFDHDAFAVAQRVRSDLPQRNDRGRRRPGSQLRRRTGRRHRRVRSKLECHLGLECI